ncbi:uncharacterized protein B0H64DRAFT_346948 [Chaetomium fimeti]|uniref:F-box domain-containing protein n=1 Tax=Chaetomium fimeti TaxID=1854472 RepID=A0AAE0LPK6_9PEZI|nr:hypothetical protein B0H64DRAFT_346948 [Chaetomium fimeti]
MAATLVHLPSEILHNILSYVDPEDLAWLPLTCRSLNNFIKGNNPLCRAIYLRILDEPPVRDLDFEQELHDIVKLKKLCLSQQSTTSNRPNQHPQTHLPFVHRTVTRLLNHAITVPTTNPTKNSNNNNNNNNNDDSTTTTTTTTNSPNSSSSTTTKNATNNTTTRTRESRGRTFPESENVRFLATLFEARPAARRKFMARSFLYERAHVLGVSGFGGGGGAEVEQGQGGGSRLAGGGSGGGSGSDRGALYGWRMPREPREACQMSAKLHCLYGWGLGFEGGGRPGATEDASWGQALTFARQRGGVYPLACSKVYDLREYTRGTKWGPFLDLGGGEDAEVRVDWEKVEAIMVVLGANIRCKGVERFPIFWQFWGKPFAGSWKGSYIPWSRDREKGEEGEVKELDQLDPYGVAGSWLRAVSFLDFSDFFHFNFPTFDELPPDVPRPPINVGQATRLILMRIRVAKVEPPGPGDHPDHPVTHFAGFSRAVEGSWEADADAAIRGTVRVTPEGEVRWTSYSVFHGEERWKSEGVQIGGIRSARGVVGTWFDKDFNPQGPCGPTAFWKISDREETSDEPQVLLEDLYPIIAADPEEKAMDEDETAQVEFDLEAGVGEPFWPDGAEDDLEDEMEGLYFFDPQDIFDEFDVLDEDPDEEGYGLDGDDDDDDDDEDLIATLAHG